MGESFRRKFSSSTKREEQRWNMRTIYHTIFMVSRPCKLLKNQKHGTHKVILKLYMFLPAICFGIFIGIILWLITTLVSASFRQFKDYVLGRIKQDINRGESFTVEIMDGL